MGILTHAVSGSIASFRTPSKVPIESLKFHFLPKQEGSGDPSPINVRPITGWTGLNGRKASKNLLQNNIVNGTEYSQGLKFVQNNNGSITITGTATNTSTKLAIIKNYTNGSFPLKAGKYRPHVWSTEVNTYLYMSIIYNNGNSSMYGDAKGSSYGYTLSEDTYVTQVRIGIQAAEGVQFDLTIYPSLEIGSVESTWEECKGRQIPITFPDGQTINGGYYDPVVGEIVEEWGYHIYDGTEEEIRVNYRTTSRDQALMLYPKGGILPLNSSGDTICNILKTTNNQHGANVTYARPSSSGLILDFARETICNLTSEEFQALTDAQMVTIVKNYLAGLYANGTPMISFYKLATPVHIPITPQDLKAFLDHNNFWSDANDITEVTYPVTESKDILKARKLIMAGSQPHIETASGSVASFDTYVKAPVKELKAHFTPVQEGSGDASPSNVRPISGWTGTNVHQSKKNLLIESRRDNRYTNNIMYYRDDGGFLLKKGTYTLSKTGETCSIYIKRVSDDETLSYKYNTTYHTFTISQDENVYFNFYKNGGIDHTVSCQLELGSTATAHEAFVAGSEIPIEFPATKNLLDATKVSRNIGGATFSYSEGAWKFENCGTGNGSAVWGSQTFPAGTYTIKATCDREGVRGFRLLCSSSSCGGQWLDWYGGYFIDSSNGTDKITFTTTEEFSVGLCFLNNSQHLNSPGTLKNIQLETGSSATKYEPYGTIYGGYVDPIRGKVVATHGIYRTVFGPSNPSGVLGDYERHGYYMNVEFKPAIDLHNDGQGPYNGKTFCNVAFWSWDYYGDRLHYYIDGRVAYIMLPVGTDPDTEIEFCAELATPIEYDITPQILKTLKGTNNIWADTNGNVDVKYWTH